jgi:hypothetical protein
MSEYHSLYTPNAIQQSSHNFHLLRRRVGVKPKYWRSQLAEESMGNGLYVDASYSLD